MKAFYPDWLRSRGLGEKAIANQTAWLARIASHHGDIDAAYDDDRCSSLLTILTYSTADGRHGRPNPSSMPIVGDIRNNLASYKSSVNSYVRFRDDLKHGENQPFAEAVGEVSSSAPTTRQSRVERLLDPASRTLADFEFDGRAAFEALIRASRYGTIAQAVASLTLFSHPDTVRQTKCKALFRAVRDPRRVGQREIIDGLKVLLDDNKSPTDAFLWANRLPRRGRDVQFNHIYAASRDPEAYTALPNICMTPAFIAKLTDTSASVRALLRFRSYQLYGWAPGHVEPPPRPEDYESLEWAAPLPAVLDVRAAMTQAMATKPKDRTVMAAFELGWLFAAPATTRVAATGSPA